MSGAIDRPAGNAATERFGDFPAGREFCDHALDELLVTPTREGVRRAFVLDQVLAPHDLAQYFH